MNDENLKTGYFRLYRSIFESRWLEKDRPLTRLEAWIWLIANSQSKDRTDKIPIGVVIVECKRGQLVRSLDKLRKDWRWNSKERVRKFLNALKNCGDIEIETLTVATRITIVNYHIYQDWKRPPLTIEGRCQDDVKTMRGRCQDDERTERDLHNTGDTDKSDIPRVRESEELSLLSAEADDKPVRSKPLDPVYSEAFLNFWKEYPRKTGKGAVWKVWKRDKLDRLIEQILNSLSIQKKSYQWTKDNGEYIPLPLTYCNQRRWEDEPKKINKPEPKPEPKPILDPEPQRDPVKYRQSMREAFEKAGIRTPPYDQDEEKKLPAYPIDSRITGDGPKPIKDLFKQAGFSVPNENVETEKQ